jgi:hypothetical protein
VPTTVAIRCSSVAGSSSSFSPAATFAELRASHDLDAEMSGQFARFHVERLARLPL